MAVIGEMAVNVVARIQKFTRDMKKANTTVGRFAKSVKRNMGIANKALGAFGLVGGGLSVIGLAVGFNRVTESIDRLAKTSAKLGLATDQLQALRFAAEKAGVENNTLDMALQRLGRRVSEAAQGTGEAKNALIELGISAQQLNQLPLDRQMRVIADRFKDVKSQTDRVRLAFKLFDSEGVALVNVLKDGAAGLDEAEKRFRKLGAAITPEDAKKIERFNDAMTDLKTALGGISQNIVISIAPGAAEFVANLAVTVGEIKKNSGILGAFVSGVGKAGGAAGRGLNRVLGTDVDSRVQRQLRSGLNTGTPAEQSVIERFNRARNPHRSPAHQLSAAAEGIRRNQRDAAGQLNSRIASAASSGVSNVFDRLKTSTSQLNGVLESSIALRREAENKLVIAGNKRIEMEKRFEDNLGKIAAGPQSPLAQGANRLIEATSAEGLAAIKRGRSPVDRLVKINEELLKEAQEQSRILGRQQELQDLLS